ncbi:DUF1302 family protein [Aromatoleum diolicum]|uniref:LysR family transcriptional regulator n=1 Tax=Aromatoleum diolicum TaxID=75796 RepID=A0ABX1Q8P7_9RHOO|nr:DUF1302 family protein [Aromatoleum diolicum]NMG74724.1 LysR family transcriptional regulator [Aromatoleum diolicum]
MSNTKVRKIAAALAMLSVGCGIAHAGDGSEGESENFFRLGGYVRGWSAFNLQDIPETEANDRGKLSMLRGSLLLDADARTGPIKWKAVGRLDREYKTDYLKDLEDLRKTNGTTGGDASSILDNYNQSELREFWGEFKVGERATFRLGKQQIVWGESDFFHAMDVVHGYDLSWRLFFEGENEEWRKPLWLASMKLDVPEADGELHAYVRPGLDRCKDIGNTYDIQGGRWFFQPYRGFDLTAVTTLDCDHPEGDKDDVTGGIRWSGLAGPLNYSLAYIKTFAADPVANSVFAPYKQAPDGPLFDLIHPMIDVLGATVSGYSAPLDAVLSAEIAYTIDQPYNVGTGALTAPARGAAAGLGLGGIRNKDTVTTMLRADKNLHFERLLGTNRPSFSSVQLFDTWVKDFRKSDDLVRLFAYGSPLSEHNTILTAFTVLNYRGDTINPGFAIGFDLTHGGGFAIPSLDLALGDNWRAKIEADLFWNSGSTKTLFDPDPKVQLFGYFARNNQLTFRLTRQF